jgi:hypothetical protein
MRFLLVIAWIFLLEMLGRWMKISKKTRIVVLLICFAVVTIIV